MAGVRRAYIGTETGVQVMAENGGSWKQERTGLEGKFIDTLVASNEAGLVFGAVAHDAVYATSDGGATWDAVLAGDVRTMAIDPNHPWTVYAGTEPVHLFRTDDGGDTWVEVEGLQRLPEEVRDKWWFPMPPHDGHVRSIFVEPRDSRIVYLGLEHGGICRTDDGGNHWQDLSAGIEYLDIHMVATDPIRQDLCYAATARGFYRSDDHGSHWVISDTGLTRDYFHDMVVRPGAASTLFLATANGTPPAWLRAGKAQSAVFRSDDAGVTWSQLHGGLPDSMERMAWNLVGDPVDDARLYVGVGEYTPNLPKGQTGDGEVWVSENRGDSWARVCRTSSPVRALCVTNR